jgi:uncharacterized protein (DUF697 family)
MEETTSGTAAPQAEETAKTMPSQHEIDAIIRNRVHSSLAIALVPIPLFDMAALAALQMEMIYKLAKAYDIPFKAEWGKQVSVSLVSGILPSLIAPKLSDLARYIPIVGPGLSLATLPLANGAATYAVGRAFAKRFATGESLCNLDMKKLGTEIKSGFEESKNTVAGWFKKNTPTAEAPTAEPQTA